METEAPSPLSDESIQALAAALRPLIREEVAAAVGDTEAPAGGASQLAEKATARLEELLGRAEEKARNLADGLGTDASALKEEAVARGRDAVDQATVQVRENPIAALLIAMGFGFILGVIFGPGRR